MNIDFVKALAGVTALGAGIAVLANATGAFEQMQRNRPQLTALVFSVALLAGVIVVAAGLLSGTTETVLGIVGLVVFGLAAAVGIWLLIDSRGERPPPSIKVAFKTDPNLSVVGSIKVEQMTASETLKVRVVANTAPDNKVTGIAIEDRLLDARMGSDSSGAVDLPLDVPVPEKKYVWVDVLAWIADKPDDCFGQRTNPKNTPGCVAMRLPQAAAAE
jgi:hypothetical protein